MAFLYCLWHVCAQGKGCQNLAQVPPCRKPKGAENTTSGAQAEFVTAAKLSLRQGSACLSVVVLTWTFSVLMMWQVGCKV